MNKMSEVIVSVCMITYRHEEFIGKAIEGVLMQKTNFKVELIISDDASPDNTEEVVKNYLNNSNELIEIFYQRHPNNIGSILNSEWALKRCIGKYIAMCEGDDYWTDPFKLQKQINFLENNKSHVLVFHNRFLLHQTNQTIVPEEILSESKSVNFNMILDNGMKIPTQTVVFRNLIEIYPKEFFSVLNGDTFLFLMLAKIGDFYFQKEINGAVYRIHDLGIWSNQKKIYKIKEGIKTFEVFLKYFGEDNSIVKILLTRRRNLLKHYLQNNEYRSLLRYILTDFNIFQTTRLKIKAKLNF